MDPNNIQIIVDMIDNQMTAMFYQWIAIMGVGALVVVNIYKK
jgi:hypothetical protein